MTKERKIPRFASEEEEEANFWDTHDTTEFWEDTEEVPQGEIAIDQEFRTRVLERAKEKELISLRLEKRQIRLAKQIALKRSIPYQTLIRSWVEEGIQRELAQYSSAAINTIMVYTAGAPTSQRVIDLSALPFGHEATKQSKTGFVECSLA